MVTGIINSASWAGMARRNCARAGRADRDLM